MPLRFVLLLACCLSALAQNPKLSDIEYKLINARGQERLLLLRQLVSLPVHLSGERSIELGEEIEQLGLTLGDDQSIVLGL